MRMNLLGLGYHSLGGLSRVFAGSFGGGVWVLSLEVVGHNAVEGFGFLPIKGNGIDVVACAQVQELYHCIFADVHPDGQVILALWEHGNLKTDISIYYSTI